MESSELAALLDRVRNGDEEAAAEVVRHFEPEVRRFIRFRLNQSSLRRVIESLDIWQSVLANFFVRISRGEIGIHDPQRLQAFLMTMARNRLLDQVRTHQADKRDARRTTSDPGAMISIADRSDSPSELLMADEVLRAVRERLEPEDLRLVEERLSGREWKSLADEFDSTPEALRKRMSRVMDAAAKSLGILDDGQ